ncbi:pyrroloquinoline quinone biosynthesis protein PqqB [Xanthomonas translucens]|uniref:Coenzyme PQQ synthesis protein B n=3 Tax=Xanthomonas campestris pv. translucens TaxID=343 RepID=A0A109HGP2_XANCT|nr:pyrroloquinoline quinone biosynthesis protein PqqB [Xanthomonas translucens]KTF39941.1 pyrroloquinoline quinone biosynthesis protein PqqB [Xanthomonas translucens pv. translucens]KWV11819.1 pyrroloquinoline quinone biosynthesis protein PqqB [Xanthomonas translucens]KWV12504.1 pyrroloquinoline quinone biosynthesis protein PqqB [Xanthomonas translucens]MCC8446273.1 pyrroloquinoline quinone biosynthesis protein PqqB [Xanthomonas translucens pv. translucens]MCS3360988.1 pyrroloquinoline quinone
MHLIVLGSAAGGGHPQWNCRTPASLRAWQQLAAAQRRTQASIAVSADNQRWLLINASPDFRQQLLATPALWPQRDLRHSPIEAVLLTSGEIDHIAGLLSMRESQRFDLYASGRVLDLLAQNPIFDALHPAHVQRHAFALDAPLSLLGLQVTPFAVPGKVPLFMESRHSGDLAGSDGETLGLTIDDGRHRLHYIPGCAAMTDALRARLRGAELVFFDGTLWRDDELVQLGVSTKTGQRMGHLSIDGEAGTLRAFADLDVARKVFIHINTTNPILDAGSAERAAVAAHGWDVAHDGMDITL